MKRYKIKSFVAFFIAICLVISAIGVVPVQAAGTIIDEPGKLTISDVIHDVEEIDEAIDDSKATNPAGDWKQAIRDGLRWNSFHIAVQKHIKNVNSAVEKKELEVFKEEKLGHKKGNYGRVDLWLYDQDSNLAHFWEIKPESYSSGAKRTSAKAQLDKYINWYNSPCKAGGDQIKSNDFYLLKYVPGGRGVKKIIYKVTYRVEIDGLIFYQFQRIYESSDDDDEDVGQDINTVTIFDNVKNKSFGDAVAAPYANDNYDHNTSDDSENDDTEEDDDGLPDLVTVITCVVIASSITIFYMSSKAKKHEYTSVDAQVVETNETFLQEVSKNSTDGKIVLTPEMQAACWNYIIMMRELNAYEYLNSIGFGFMGYNEKEIKDQTVQIQAMFPLYNQAATVNPPIDPLIIDLGEPGINLCTMENGVNFDLDNNGYAEKTAWTGTEDGFLALDRDGNGMIDNGGELFGDRVILKDGITSASGFEALAELDTNGDGKIDASDTDFEKLLVWIDANQNGKSEAGELKSLSAHGIISISLSYRETSITDEETGVLNAETADVTININGTERTTEISEFWFPVNTSDTTHVGIVTAGNIPDIESALANDTTGELAKWVYMFTESDDYVWKHYYLRQILYILADAQDIDPASRGGNIDARNLKVIEKFMGREFDGVGGKDPNANAAVILKEIYSDIETEYYNILNLYGSLGGYLTLAYEYENENGNVEMDLSFVYYVLDAKLSMGENIDCLVYDLGLYLKSYDEINGTGYFDEYTKYYKSLSSRYESIISRIQTETVYIIAEEKIYVATEANEIIFGGSGDNEIHGNGGNDTLYGEGGSDILIGGAGNDILYGGAGTDALSGGYGNDSYLFNVGDGEDTIHDNYTYADGGEDKIIFGEGISPDMIEMWTEEADLVITYGEGDQITVKDAYRYSGGINMIEYIEFADGTVWTAEDIAPRASVRYGSDGNDTISGFDSMPGYSCDETIYGGAGNDRIYGYAGNDIIYGQEGDDELYGGDGNGTFVGGTGNDTLNGGRGNDTYIFYVGDGNDIIYDGYSYEDAGEDRIIFGEGISPDMIEMWTEE
ncbi:MAG: hypothetical protein NC428_02330, partial [Clostridium sp.]|nr:hypothetical protein [Clostridium sp.]